MQREAWRGNEEGRLEWENLPQTEGKSPESVLNWAPKAHMVPHRRQRGIPPGGSSTKAEEIRADRGQAASRWFKMQETEPDGKY